MKHTLGRLCVALLAATLLLSLLSAGAEGRHKLTLMIYMCGGNLESEYGSASADLQEMLDSGFDPAKVNVLVMAGGARRWNTGFDADHLTINQLGRGGMRTVWRGDCASMGASETLTSLLDFGVANYPADEYALILWDHGGGPLEGICWDELFSLDGLTLHELDGALDASALPKKLSWIGFDACLMGSAEVASAMSDHAKYMIASQETEPARGWNYSFLKGIEDDWNGGVTGRRIVDAYFEGQEDAPETLTLACCDLSKLRRVASAMDDFFAPFSQVLDADSFAGFSTRRMSAVDFGSPIRGLGDAGYDLVDLRGLVAEYDGAGSALDDALNAAVVYSRANEEGANGLSIYHPYVNKQKYAGSWGRDYNFLGLSSGYQRYINRFGALLTGDALVDWSGLPTPDRQGDTFSVPLTPQQRADFASAQLLVLAEVNPRANQVAYAPLYISQAELDENGRLSATYTGRALYLTDPQGKPIDGPLGVWASGSRPGRYGTYAVYFSDNDPSMSVRRDHVLYVFDEPEDESGMVEGVDPWMVEAASHTFTNRIPIDESAFPRMGFQYDLRMKPDGTDTLPGFEEWDTCKGYYSYRAIFLPMDWRLRFIDDRLTGDRLYATFQIADAQQNLYCTPLVPLENANQAPISVSPAIIEDTSVRLELSMALDASPLESGLKLQWKLTNLTESDIAFLATPMLLNGRRLTAASISNNTYGLTIAPGETVGRVQTLPDAPLEGLEALSTIDFEVGVENCETRETIDSLPVHVRLAGCDAGVLAQAAGRDPEGNCVFASRPVETDYGRFQLLARPLGDRVDMELKVENTSEAVCSYSLSGFCLNHRQNGPYWSVDDLPPGMEFVSMRSLERNGSYLYGLDEITCVSADLEVRDPQTYDTYEQLPLRFEFDGFSVADLAPHYQPLGETSAGGLRWQLLSLQDGGLFDDRLGGVVRVTNERDTPVDSYVTVSVDGVAVDWTAIEPVRLAPGNDMIWTFDSIYSRRSVYGLGIGPEGNDDFSFEDYLPLDRRINRHGHDSIASITFAPQAEGLEDACATLTLAEPVRLRDDRRLQMPAGAPLLQGKVRAELYAMALGANGLALCMELTNDTDRAVRLQLQKATVAGKIVDYKYYSKDFFLPAHTALDDVFKVTTKYDLEAGEAFHDLTIGFSWDEGAATAAISGFDGVCGSTEGVLLTPEELTIQPARIGNE